jgi:hypothetical protein
VQVLVGAWHNLNFATKIGRHCHVGDVCVNPKGSLRIASL